MRKSSLIGLVGAIVLLSVRLAEAQTAALVGTVMRDTLGHALAGGIEVRIPQLNATAATNYLGEFRFTRIPPGTYLVTIRTVGYMPYSDSIAFTANQAVTREFVLSPVATELDPVKTRAAGVRRYVSPALNGFEERRLSAKGGYFVPDSVMRANESRTLPNVLLSRIPGITQVIRNDSVFIASNRSGTDGGLVFQKKAGNTCYVTLYFDGVVRWQGPKSQTSAPLPDFNSINVSDLAGAEFYPGSASLPIQYGSGGSTCGVLLLWTRER
jgi:hypothetical protein